MRICISGHFIGDGAKTCAICGGRVTSGKKVSLFLPDALYKDLSQDAKTLGDSLSVVIVRHIQRDRSRKAKAKGV